MLQRGGLRLDFAGLFGTFFKLDFAGHFGTFFKLDFAGHFGTFVKIDLPEHSERLIEMEHASNYVHFCAEVWIPREGKVL